MRIGEMEGIHHAVRHLTGGQGIGQHRIQHGEAPQGAQASSSKPTDDNVVDAEFKEVKK